MNSALILLQKYWKHQSFRSPQEQIINAVVNNQNVLALLPTGAGKSLCFQIPALLKDGICIVISPLIALMEDQVNSLQKKGIKAIALNSKYNKKETIQAFDNLRFGNYKFLYLSPEKLQSEYILEKISQLKINLIAVDEAHCISEWGHDFRPAYLKISILKNILPKTNIIALTASATPKVMEDIVNNLLLEDEDVQIFKKSFFRDNLAFKLIKTENVLENLKQILLKINEPVIIYTNTRKNCINISNYLNNNNFKSNYYHGGLQNNEKLASLNNWINEINPIMVATNAFGMGIDKSNVRAVIHTNIPNSIENYMQEVGRAGRDGKKSIAYLIFNESSIYEFKNFLNKGIANTQFCKEVYTKINQFYQISPSEFSETIHAFNLQDFCSTYNLPILKTFNAFNIFENENIIEIQQNINKKSTLKTIVSSSYLFEYEKRNPNLNAILKVILRNYGGTFEQFIPISETLVAKKLNTSKPQIIKLLSQLNLDKIIIYKKADTNSQLKFLVPREDHFVINRISKNIESRNKTKINKADAIIKYVANDKICRNVLLLQYFGEENIEKCHICDVCISQKTNHQKVDFKEISNKILILFDTANQLNSDDIVYQLTYDKKYIVKTLQLLVEKNTLQLTSQNKFEKVKS